MNWFDSPQYIAVIIKKLTSRRFITTSNCWEYTGYLEGGYGRMRFKGKAELVSRISIRVFKPGEYIECLNVLHTCDNPKCFNPDHLYMGTQTQNGKDSVERGRARGGNTDKMFCPRNHPYDEVNTYIEPKTGRRQCKICRKKHLVFRDLNRALGI